MRRLETLDQTELLTDLNVPGFNLHGLHGVPNGTASTSTTHGVSPLSGIKVKRCGLILNNIIEVKLWKSIQLNVL
ncbi:MAG: hypothetical protein ACUZ8O_17535 [Candidatus Anammoxibacter sp.]